MFYKNYFGIKKPHKDWGAIKINKRDILPSDNFVAVKRHSKQMKYKIKTFINRKRQYKILCISYQHFIANFSRSLEGNWYFCFIHARIYAYPSRKTWHQIHYPSVNCSETKWYHTFRFPNFLWTISSTANFKARIRVMSSLFVDNITHVQVVTKEQLTPFSSMRVRMFSFTDGTMNQS